VKMPLRTIALLLGVALLALVPSAAQAKKPKPVYLSLGDSLSVGVQPKPSGVNQNTAQGYPRQLAAQVGGVKVLEYGCGFATSQSFVQGKRPCAPARNPGYKNTSASTSQLAAAEKYLRAHRKTVKFVTLNIGANDVAGCAKNGTVDLPCVTTGLAAIKKYTPKIAKGLRKAAGKKVAMAGMTLYDPFLQYWYTNPGLAQLSVGLAKDQVNKALIAGYKAGGLKVADVATAFGTYKPFSQTTTYGGRSDVPVAVANICKYTWMCTPKPRGPNIHANKAGYKLIATTFRKALGKAAR
jgi:lysophospholipase L1-like esterase